MLLGDKAPLEQCCCAKNLWLLSSNPVLVVWCAAGEYAGDSVAVKLLPIGSVFAEDSRKEACLALCLHHPNIVSGLEAASKDACMMVNKPIQQGQLIRFLGIHKRVAYKHCM